MSEIEKIQLFEQKKIRTAWDEENAGVAKEGAEVARNAREDFEKRIGHSIISPEKAIDHIQSPEELPFSKPEEQ